MRQSLCKVICALILVALAGCSGKTERLIQVSVKWSGYSPRDIEDLVAYPIGVRLLGVPGIARVTTISTMNRVDAYIAIVSGADVDTVKSHTAEAIAKLIGTLPADVTSATVTVLGRGARIPEVTMTQVDAIEISVRRVALARHGITVRDFNEVVRQAIGKGAVNDDVVKKFEAHTIALPDGEVRLSELADIRIVKEPSHIVTTWPPDEMEK